MGDSLSGQRYYFYCQYIKLCTCSFLRPPILIYSLSPHHHGETKSFFLLFYLKKSCFYFVLVLSISITYSLLFFISAVTVCSLGGNLCRELIGLHFHSTQGHTWVKTAGKLDPALFCCPKMSPLIHWLSDLNSPPPQRLHSTTLPASPECTGHPLLVKKKNKI